MRTLGTDWYTYILKDPNTNEVRYVGWTTNTRKRLYGHIDDGRQVARGYKVSNMHKAYWIRKLLSAGQTPVMEVVESGSDYSLCIESECKWIAYYKSIGSRLVNMSDGGEGICGYSPNSEIRHKIRMANIGKKQSSETKAKRSASMMGHVFSQETKDKISSAHMGRPKSEEAKRKMSESKSGKPGHPMTEMQLGVIRTIQSERIRSDDERRRIASKLQRLTEDQVRCIRMQFASGRSNRKIASDFNVGAETIRYIRIGRRYKGIGNINA